jgi:hypothetical protein
LFCKDLVSLKSCVEQLQFPHEKGSSSHSECLVQLFCLVQLTTLTHTKHTYMWVKSKNTTSCMQQNASTEYKSATNKAKQLISFNGFNIDSLENYQVFKRKPSPFFVKRHKFAQNNYFSMTSDVLDRKLNMQFFVFL